MNRHTHNALIAGASAIAIASAVPTATAQESEDNPRTLSTITVTATQRAESIQDVPIAVTALDAEDLERAGVADVTSLESIAPSFNLNTTDSQSGGVTMRLRGVGTTGNNIGLESAVGVFVDGVYLSRPGIALNDLLDIEQVEVLRGPQGTLFGRNTSAGALNIKTKRPDLDEFEGFGNLTIGNYNLVSAQLGVNIPIVEDKVGVRLAGAIRDRDGTIESLDGSESNTLDRMVLRGQAFADFGESGTVRVILDYAESDDRCCDAVWHNDSAAAAIFAAPTGAFNGLPTGALDATGGAPNIVGPGLDDYRSNAIASEFVDTTESTGLSLEYIADTPLGELTYIGSYREFENGWQADRDFVGADVFAFGVTPAVRAIHGNTVAPNVTTIDSLTHELRLKGTAFDDRLDWLVGAYYSDEEINVVRTDVLLGDLQESTAITILGGQAGNVFTNLAQGVSTEGDFATSAFEQNGESLSIFTHNILSVTDRLDLTVGLRYVDESKDGRFQQVNGQHNACNAYLGTVSAGLAPPAILGDNVIQLDELAAIVNCFVFTAPIVDPDNLTGVFSVIGAGPQAGILDLLPQEFDETFEDEELVYTLKASYELAPDTNIYAGFTHGFKSGGFNLDPGAAAGGESPQFRSELVDAWEIGLKTDFWDGRARANIAVFLQEMEDFQVLEFTGTRFQTFNVGKAESVGVEFEGAAQLTDTFAATLGVTYTDAKYPDDCSPFDVNAADFNRNALTLCGNPLTNAPEWVAIAGGTFETPVFDNQFNFFATGSVRYETERRTSTQPVEAITRLQLENGGTAATSIPLVNPSVADLRALAASQPLLPGDFQDDNTKVNLRVGLESEDDRWAIEIWGNNVFDERTKNVTFNVPLRGGYDNRARGQFVQDPATYGVTLRTKF